MAQAPDNPTSYSCLLESCVCSPPFKGQPSRPTFIRHHTDCHVLTKYYYCRFGICSNIPVDKRFDSELRNQLQFGIVFPGHRRWEYITPLVKQHGFDKETITPVSIRPRPEFSRKLPCVVRGCKRFKTLSPWFRIIMSIRIRSHPGLIIRNQRQGK